MSKTLYTQKPLRVSYPSDSENVAWREGANMKEMRYIHEHEIGPRAQRVMLYLVPAVRAVLLALIIAAPVVLWLMLDAHASVNAEMDGPPAWRPAREVVSCPHSPRTVPARPTR